MQRRKAINGADADSKENPTLAMNGSKPATSNSTQKPQQMLPNGITNGSTTPPTKHQRYSSTGKGDLTPPRIRNPSANIRTSSPLNSNGFTNGTRSGTGPSPPLQQTRTFVNQQQRASSLPHQPLSASPYQSNFAFTAIPESGDDVQDNYPARQLRHSRSQSGFPYSGQSPQAGSGLSPGDSPIAPPSPSPSSGPRSPRISVPHSPMVPFTSEDFNGSVASANGDSHHHSRIHSRNLSVFFPRPGGMARQPSAIEEDDGQEIEYSAPDVNISSSNSDSPPTSLVSNFKFGDKNPAPIPPLSPRPNGNVPKRRGHHHKHSLSHNFFSFMDPTMPQTASYSASSPSPSLSLGAQTLPTPSTTHFPASTMQHHYVDATPGTQASTISSTRAGPMAEGSQIRGQAAAIAEFILGVWLWVEGQRKGSLACTGLGYWVAFDAAGIWLRVLGEQLRRQPRTTRQSYGYRRMESVALFAQTIYLIFAALYICKEAFEHLLLASEGPDTGDAHHHHSPDESSPDGFQYPITIVWLSLFSLLGSSFGFNNHDRLVEATGNHLPTPLSLIRAVKSFAGSKYIAVRDQSAWANNRLISSPFTILPTLFAVSILTFPFILPPSQYHAADVLLASIETVLTFMVAYPAAVALGKVLLQTAPERGLAGGQMEAFLRLMRELEHHPHIAHLPAPHLWQVTPVPSHHDLSSEEGTLVATVQLHVRKDLDNGEVLKLTSEVWERCTRALGVSGAGVAVSVVRD